MEFVELKNRTMAELQEMLKVKRAELHSLRFKAVSREVKAAHQIRMTRAAVAQILTALKFKQVAEEQKKNN